MLNLQNIWFVLDLIISWRFVGVPHKPEGQSSPLLHTRTHTQG